MTRRQRESRARVCTVSWLMIAAYTVGSWGWVWAGWLLAVVAGVALAATTGPIDADRDFADRHPAGRFPTPGEMGWPDDDDLPPGDG